MTEAGGEGEPPVSRPIETPAQPPGSRPQSKPSLDLVDGRYRIVERLGAGSMGVVFRAEDIWLGRTVAIKLVDPAHGSNPTTMDRFIKEARALAQIRHQNVVQIYAFGPHDASFFFAMEHLAGGNLESVIDEHVARGTTMPLSEVLSIITAIGAGLSAVHDKKLVHRDVKPSNVVLEHGTGRPVLIDFGLARRGRSSSNPRMSIAAGTPSYMAPEQSRDPDGTMTTPRSDLYSLACSLFEMLTGRSVFEGRDIYAVLAAHLTAPPPQISSLRPELAPFDAVLTRALAKEPEARHASVDEFIAAVTEAAKKIGSDAEVVSRRGFDVDSSAPRALFFHLDPGIVRQLQRSLDRALSPLKRRAYCEEAQTMSEVARSFEQGRVELVVFDEETAGDLSRVIREIRSLPGGTNAQFVILSRNLIDTRARLGPLGVQDLLPKPLNAHVLSSVIARIAERGAFSSR